MGYGDYFKQFITLDRVLSGIKRLLRHGKRQKREGVSTAFLRKVRRLLDLTSYEDAMIWCALLIAFFGLLRSGEIAAPFEAYRSRGFVSKR